MLLGLNVVGFECSLHFGCCCYFSHEFESEMNVVAFLAGFFLLVFG